MCNVVNLKSHPVRQGQTTTPGTTCPTLCDKCVGSLTSSANQVTVEVAGDGVYDVLIREDLNL